MITTTHSASKFVRAAAGAAAAFSMLLAPTAAFADAKPVTAPAIPGVAALPGPVVDPGKPADTMKTLKVSPDMALPGTATTITGSGLPAGKDVTLTWSTATVDWLLDPRADSVDYLGRKTNKFTVRIATAHTDANGAFSVPLKTPHDWGGLHDIYAVVDGVQVAKGGFLIKRHATISTHRGPVGTPITITYSGLGSSLYEGGGSLYWDNKFAGVMTANWGRGVAVTKIRAAGEVGTHVIELKNSLTIGYLNVPQSPLPWTVGAKFKFTITKDAGRPAPTIDWPVNVAPTLSGRTTLDAVRTVASPTASTATLSETSGQVLSKVDVTASNLAPNAPVTLQWATVVGNRVNCTGTCWAFATVPLGTATSSADGSLKTGITVPDGLGGWHAVQIAQAGEVKAAVPYYVKRSFASAQPISDLTLRQGQHFTIHLKGLGWTQLDNTIAIDYDNAYVGYGCGFNSQGDVVIDLVATGKPGTHLIDGYPLLYTQQPSYANTPYGMIPMLSYARDLPGLALGYQLPAMRVAITIVK